MFGKLRYQSKYLTIQYFATKKHWSISWMCKKLSISKAGYYKWLKRSIPQNEKENIVLAHLVKEYDYTFNHILGYRRMTLWINRFFNKHYSVNRIHRIMKKLGIRSVIRKKRPKYLYSKPDYTAANILKRDFFASRPNEKWLSDVTEFKWFEGKAKHKLYLCAILDLYDRSIVAYGVSNSNDVVLTVSTFDQAIKSNPKAKPLFHSDRGGNYTNIYFHARLINQGVLKSMSRVGRCIDNGPMEGFWGIIKSEMYYQHKF
ncbi:MAG: IS3 family transposase [Phascolarctobacterium sp.]|nr:IS3 family transposase [Phascolarctobacterium sp.]